MKILYIGCHATLEYDEVKLFHEMGHQVFSHGAYRNPEESAEHLPRPKIEGLPFFKRYYDLTNIYPAKTEIPDELISEFDVIIVTGGFHDIPVLSGNWKRFNKRKVVWRSIGQSTETTETALQSFRREGLKLVRYSPEEKQIPNFAGEDAFIRFYKDPAEYKDWNGNDKKIVNFTQSLLARRHFCHYDQVMEITKDLPFKVYGTGNEDLGSLNGGELKFPFLKEMMRDVRCVLYAGTWPAPYTLSFMELMMTGTPVVAIGKGLAENIPGVKAFEFYEVHKIIKNDINGYVSDSIGELRAHLKRLLADHALAKRIGDAGRQTAIDLFGKEQRREEWRKFFESL